MQVEAGRDEIIERIAALDVSKAEVVCCARMPGPGRQRMQEVRTTSTMTAALLALGDWLAELGVTRRLRLPGAQRLLQQPQPHHVAQVADRSVHPELVGESPQQSPLDDGAMATRKAGNAKKGLYTKPEHSALTSCALPAMSSS